MDDMHIKWDAKQERRFAGLLREMSAVTRREMPTVIRNAGRDYCRAALRFTPLSHPRYSEADFRQDGGFLVTTRHRHTNRVVSFIGTRQQLMEQGMVKPGDPIRGRGFARVGWLLGLLRLGVNIRFRTGKTPSIKSITGTGDFVDGRRRASPYVEIANQVPYIEKLDRGELGSTPHNIMARAMNATAMKMEQILTRLSSRMAARWAR